jgi:penicillin-binding protein 1C
MRSSLARRRSGLPYSPEMTRFDVFEFWSSGRLKRFREAGMPRRTPPPLPACAGEDAGDVPRIASPLMGVSYALRRSRPDGVIALDASVAADVRSLFWFDGVALIGKLQMGAGALPWRPAADGAHLLRVIDDHGRAAERDVQVRFSD